MSQSNADLPLPRQFCRQWDERPVRIRFLSELTKRELASLERDYGERALASLPARLVQALGPRARRVLAQRLGRQRVKRLRKLRRQVRLSAP